MKVKWGRENYPNIDVNTDEEPLLFKAQLFALTGVQPERQKVMCKGLALKDAEWNIQLKEVSGPNLLMTQIDSRNCFQLRNAFIRVHLYSPVH